MRSGLWRQCVVWVLVAIGVIVIVGQGRADTPVGSAAIVGGWTIDAGFGPAIYRFEADGTFTLTFEGPIGGGAGGKWRVEGNTLVMLNTWSDVSYTKVGDTETAQIVSVSGDVMKLRSPNIKGEDEVLAFQKMRTPPEFQKGKTDEPKIAGTYRMRGRGEILSLAADGTAIFPFGGRMFIGEWSQRRGVLTIRSHEVGSLMRYNGQAWMNWGDAAEALQRSAATAPSQRAVRQGWASTQASATTQAGGAWRGMATTRPAGAWRGMPTSMPSVRMYPLPPLVEPASALRGTTRPMVLRRAIAEIDWPVVQVDDRWLVVEMEIGEVRGMAEFYRVQP